MILPIVLSFIRQSSVIRHPSSDLRSLTSVLRLLYPVGSEDLSAVSLADPTGATSDLRLPASGLSVLMKRK